MAVALPRLMPPMLHSRVAAVALLRAAAAPFARVPLLHRGLPSCRATADSLVRGLLGSDATDEGFGCPSVPDVHTGLAPIPSVCGGASFLGPGVRAGPGPWWRSSPRTPNA